MPEAVIVEAVRSPMGRYGGQLSSVRPDDLAAHVIRALLERTGIDPADVEDVIFGAANQAGEDNRNVARMASLLAGLPVTVAGQTVNRLCGSGLQAINTAAMSVWTGNGEVFIAGGVESMSRAPFVMGKPERGFPRGDLALQDTTMGWRFINPALARLYYPYTMGETAENLAEKYGIPRAQQDEFALMSHRKAVAAIEAGRMAEEIAPLEVSGPRGERVRVSVDEPPRPDTSLEKLAKLPPVFREGGTVTAGNSSGINDGAAAVLVMERGRAEAMGLRPLAVIRSQAVAGVDPAIMGIGPVPATRKALARAGLALSDIEVIELNEAFAAQSLAVLQEWGIAPDDPRLNPNGGAIALGHPLGCSGARIMTTLLHEMRRRAARYGLATMCIGVGQGIATVVERLEGA